MTRQNRFAVGALAMALVFVLEPVAQGDETPVPLITTQDTAGNLADWQFFCEKAGVRCSDVWQLADGVLICKGSPKGYIRTQKDYTDFVLRLQWRWPGGEKAGNGGVLIRTTGGDKIWPKSLEAQINAGQAGDFWGLDGYRLQGPEDRTKSLDHAEFGKLTNVAQMGGVEKPAGQWNQYEIVAEREIVILKINGEVVNKATRCDVVPGKICLTAEGDEIHFRHVELIEK